MKRYSYIKYIKYEAISISLSTYIWLALVSFTIMSTSLLGVENITFLELLLFTFGLLGTYIAFRGPGSYRLFTILEIVLETLFLFLILYLIYVDSNYVAVSIYLVMILGKLVRPGVSEKGRVYEDTELKKDSEKKMLQHIRKRNGYLSDIFGILGGLTAVLFLSILKVDLNTFAVCMLLLNVIQNMFDYSRWIKYLK